MLSKKCMGVAGIAIFVHLAWTVVSSSISVSTYEL